MARNRGAQPLARSFTCSRDRLSPPIPGSPWACVPVSRSCPPAPPFLSIQSRGLCPGKPDVWECPEAPDGADLALQVDVWLSFPQSTPCSLSAPAGRRLLPQSTPCSLSAPGWSPAPPPEHPLLPQRPGLVAGSSPRAPPAPSAPRAGRRLLPQSTPCSLSAPGWSPAPPPAHPLLPQRPGWSPAPPPEHPLLPQRPGLVAGSCSGQYAGRLQEPREGAAVQKGVGDLWALGTPREHRGRAGGWLGDQGGAQLCRGREEEEGRPGMSSLPIPKIGAQPERQELDSQAGGPWGLQQLSLQVSLESPLPYCGGLSTAGGGAEEIWLVSSLPPHVAPAPPPADSATGTEPLGGSLATRAHGAAPGLATGRSGQRTSPEVSRPLVPSPLGLSWAAGGLEDECTGR
ncbi:translation initiation factor IF-2-like [Antechinus flavipes]|uniref:translation initiation factor IF-2-like n=1 Tax=Antechinus flavipes TaxID=38775 RepID=UPI002236BDF4|nr:translation initiation factor IF-2-like [Antechinus flavipes]